MKYQVQDRESGYDMDNTYDTYEKAKTQMEKFVKEDRKRWSIKKQKKEYNVYDTEGSLENPEKSFDSKLEAQNWINNKENGEFYEIIEIED